MKYFKRFEGFKFDHKHKPSKNTIKEIVKTDYDLYSLIQESIEQALQFFQEEGIDLGREFKEPKKLRDAKEELKPLYQKVRELKPKGKPTPEQIEQLKNATQELNNAKETISKMEDMFKKQFAEKMASPERKVFENIVRMLGEQNKKLIGPFVKWHFKDKVPLESDENDEHFSTSLTNFFKYYVANKSKLEQYLPKKVEEYDDFESLGDDITHANREAEIRKVLTEITPSIRRTITDLSDDEKNILYQFSQLSKEFKDKFPWGYYNEPKNKMTKFDIFDGLEMYVSSALSGSVDNRKEKIITSLSTRYKGKWEMVLNTKDILMIKTYDKELLRDPLLSSSQWCIHYSQKAYYDTYVNPLNGMTQYVIYDFRYPDKDAKSMYGISISPDGKTRDGACQDWKNEYVKGELNYFESNLGIDKSLFEPTYKDMPKYKSLIDNVVSYQDYKNAIKNIEETENEETADKLKTLLVNNFNIANFTNNMIKTSNNWEELLQKIEQVKNEQIDFYKAVRNILNYEDILNNAEIRQKMFEGYGLDNNGKSPDELKTEYAFVREMNMLMYSLYMNSEIDKIIANVRPINSDQFIDQIVKNLQPPSRESLYKAVEYFKEDDNVLTKFLIKFNNSLVNNTKNRKILDEVLSEKNNFNNLYEYFKKNPLIVSMINKIPKFAYNFFKGESLDFMIETTFNIDKIRDGAIDGRSIINNQDKDMFYESLIKAMSEIIVEHNLNIQEVMRKLEKLADLRDNVYKPNDFRSVLFEDHITNHKNISIDTLDDILRALEIDDE